MSDSSKAIFLSYASQDAEAARRICDALRTAGVEVWFDVEGGLEHGDEWDAKIRRQIKDCVLFIPIISANTQARHEGYFRIEWELAAQRAMGIASGIPFILPVVIDDTREPNALVPDRFRAVQWTRLRGGEVPTEVRQRFLKLWSHRIDAPTAGTGGRKPATESRTVADDGPLPSSMASSSAPRRRTRRWAAGMAVLVLALGATLGWRAWRTAETRRQRLALRADIERLIKAEQIGAAFALANRVRREAADDPELDKMWKRVSSPSDFDTTPSGAEVYVKEYRTPNAEWQHIGRTPLPTARLPKAYLRLKIEREGCTTLEWAVAVAAKMRFTLDANGTVPAGMVRVTGGTKSDVDPALPMALGDVYYFDRYEVSNREFKEFVERGGYTDPTWWKQPFMRAGRTLSREEAMAEFHDATGRPGPATWRNGTYRAGDDDLPVTGVSWFEAAAYAEFVGKRLPSIYHWRGATTILSTESVVPYSNFSGRGLAPRGQYQGMTHWGIYDLAGNAKEWCWNEGNPDTRYILGGAWREPDYLYTGRDALSPFDRSEANGFRCMKVPDPAKLAKATDDPLPPKTRNYATEQPVSDEVFAIIRGLYAYDASPLEARVEATDDSDPRWRKEKVSYWAAYGNERIPAYLFIPRSSTPPYQTIAYFPGSGSEKEKSSDNLRNLDTVALLVASGRAVMYPVYQGTYERGAGRGGSTATAHRDWMIQIGKDFGRTLDYLETRADIDAGKLGYAGNSSGAALGAMLPALQPRIKVNVLMLGGFYETRRPPEIDQINFAPRNTAPTLMLNGRFDFTFPLEANQRPMFRWLGAPAEHKKHVLFDTGHALRPEQIASEVYAWLDRYLGLVK